MPQKETGATAIEKKSRNRGAYWAVIKSVLFEKNMRFKKIVFDTSKCDNYVYFENFLSTSSF